MGYKIDVPLQEQRVRIVGFEITPYSVPLGRACTPGMLDPLRR